MKKILPLIIVWALLVTFPAILQAADLKLGFVDAVRLLEDAPQARDATERLQQEFATREEEINRLQVEVARLEDRMSRDSAIMTDSERRSMNLDIMAKKRELRRLQEDFREDINIRRSDALGGLQELIKATIQEVGDAGGFHLIFFEGIAYADDALDITDEVLEGLMRRYQETSRR